jgi:DNA-binding transcriptional LysR family regulator
MWMPDLEIDLLRAFVAVAETGSFTSAAEVIGRSQSAVSQKLLRLEEVLGEKVFDRTSRALSLTRKGERLLVHARRMLELNDGVIREFRQPKATGSLRLGVSEDFIPAELPKLLARFSRLYPNVHIELMTGLSCDLLAAYDANALDAVIAKKDNSVNRGRVIWREQLVWMAADDYEPDFSKPARLVLLRPPCAYREVMIASLDALRREWTAACTASSLMGVQAAVAGGLGATVLGKSFVQSGLKVLKAPEFWPALPMTEITVIGEDSKVGDLVRPLIEYLTESLSKNDALTRAA